MKYIHEDMIPKGRPDRMVFIHNNPLIGSYLATRTVRLCEGELWKKKDWLDFGDSISRVE